jgi:carbamoyl-phosphate synthase large subunit
MNSGAGVLLTSAAGKLPLLRALEHAVERVLPGSVVVAGDASPRALSRWAWPNYWRMPSIGDTDFDSLLAELRSREIGFLIPSRDGELEFYSAHREAFTAAGIHVMVSGQEAIASSLDKCVFAQNLHDAGLPAIPTYLSLEDVPAECSTIVVKERMGAGSHSLGMNLGRDEARHWAGLLDQPIFQPWVPGTEFSIDSYVTMAGRFVGSIVRERVLVRNGESVVTTTVDLPELGVLGRAIVERLGIRGHCVSQVMMTEGGPLVIETNARVGGASTLAFAAGLDSLAFFLNESMDDGFLTPEFSPLPTPLTLVRGAMDVIS